MQKISDQTSKMLLKTESEIFDAIVSSDNPFRKLNKLIDFEELISPLREECYSDLGTTGIDIIKGFKSLLVQFWENYSDRQMEKCLQENIAVRWFAGFGLVEETPDFSYFSKLRTRIGAKRLADIFNNVNAKLNSLGLFGNVFTFIDASAIITKTALWEERDKAIADGEEKLNNLNVGDYAADPDARWGAKGKDKIWFGYKRHNAVDMRYGLISKLAVTPANVLDFKALQDICPKGGMAFMDKLYDTKKCHLILKANSCASAIIRKNNNKDKNRDLDRWRSKIRMPFEGTFSKLNHHARYRGRIKVLFQNFAEAIAFNLKKAIKILPNPLGA